METVFGINMVALVDGQPRLLSLKEMLDAFLRHRREIVTRRTVFELRKARERGHILEGLAVALANIDEIIAVIKASPSPSEAKTALMSRPWASGAVPRDAGARRRHQHAARGRGRSVRHRRGGLPADGNTGTGDPGHAPEPPHRARAGQDHRRVSGAAGADPRPERHSRATPSACWTSFARSSSTSATPSPTRGAPRSSATTKISPSRT